MAGKIRLAQLLDALPEAGFSFLGWLTRSPIWVFDVMMWSISANAPGKLNKVRVSSTRRRKPPKSLSGIKTQLAVTKTEILLRLP